jgi:transcriptional regulator with XRE-family HTH domain
MGLDIDELRVLERVDLAMAADERQVVPVRVETRQPEQVTGRDMPPRFDIKRSPVDRDPGSAVMALLCFLTHSGLHSSVSVKRHFYGSTPRMNRRGSTTRALGVSQQSHGHALPSLVWETLGSTSSTSSVAEEKVGPSSAAERLDTAQLGALIREHRGRRSLRQASAEAGVSLSTMSRVEAGAQPDLASFTALCAWVGVPPSKFFTPIAERVDTQVEVAIAHLSADPRLTPEHASSIASVIRQMYEALAINVGPAKSLVACHLRAAPSLRPGVPERLGSVLIDIHRALEERVKSGLL